MSRQRHSNVTVRSGTSEKHWYLIAGYIALALVGIAWVGLLMFEGAGFAAGSMLAIVWLGIAAGGVFVMPALFKDSAYVRDTRRGWRPKWWYYIGTPFAVGAVAYLASSALEFYVPMVVGLLAFIPVVFGAHCYYLYQRHKYIGVP